MAKKSIRQFINYRLLLVHIIASWFFMYAVFMLAYLLDPKGFEVFKGAVYNNNTPIDHLMEILLYSPYIGLVIALVVSLVICIKKEWPMINSAIVFVLSFLFKRFGLTGWSKVKPLFLAPGSLFASNNVMYYLINGIVLLAIGIAIFSLKATNNFIAKGKPVNLKN